jgi:hypothetical protein
MKAAPETTRARPAPNVERAAHFKENIGKAREFAIFRKKIMPPRHFFLALGG